MNQRLEGRILGSILIRIALALSVVAALPLHADEGSIDERDRRIDH